VPIAFQVADVGDRDFGMRGPVFWSGMRRR
jgi:hypothetical protein